MNFPVKKRKRKPRFRSFTEKCKPEKTRILAYFKQFEKTYPFQNLFYRKPTCDIYVLQSRQGQLLGKMLYVKIKNLEIRKLRIIFSRFPRFPRFPSFGFATFSFFKRLFFSIFCSTFVLSIYVTFVLSIYSTFVFSIYVMFCF